ncbi:MAG: fumarate reductase/succinate dehydrogenase flavoprotein domain protein [Sporomusa sp.]|nr:fumarate reductase/succinate dehydrogenase flavoprotein domain protein [Sporomusa sp.]
MNIIHADVLVVGGGGGGLRAALAAYEKNNQAKVALATKGMLGKSGVTALACSDRMAFHAALEHTEPKGEDSWKLHADDIYRIGGEVSDYNLAELLAKNGKEAFYYLDQLGVPFVKKDGLADQFVTDGSDYPRACYTGPKTAVHIEEALVKRIKQTPIEVLEFSMIAQLVLKKGQVIGAIAIDTRKKDLEKAVYAISAPSVILATGGAGLAYAHNVFPGGMTGDGYALAYQAGAELVNMEFIQIGIASTKTKFNCSGSMMRALPRFINDQGEEFLAKYFSPGTSLTEIYDLEFKKGATWPTAFEHKTHIIDIAVYKEVQEGRKVYLDYSKNPTDFAFSLLSPENQARYEVERNADQGKNAREASPLARLYEINTPTIQWFKERGIDLAQGDMVEIAACAQHFQGGVKIDEVGQATVKGLWAVGETAGGQHGANRPGGNALLDCQVFGKIAGESAIAWSNSQEEAQFQDDRAKIEEVQAAFSEDLKNSLTGQLPARVARRSLQEIMNTGVSMIRTEKGLRTALQKLAELKEQQVCIDDMGLAYYLENQNMYCVAEMVLQAALVRDESRGPHLRFDDYQDNVPVARRDAEWQKYLVVCCEGKNLKVEDRKPVTSQHDG